MLSQNICIFQINGPTVFHNNVEFIFKETQCLSIFPRHPNTSWEGTWTPKTCLKHPSQEVFGCLGFICKRKILLVNSKKHPWFFFAENSRPNPGEVVAVKKNPQLSKDRPDMTGSTPLILAAKNGSLEVWRLQNFVRGGFPTPKNLTNLTMDPLFEYDMTWKYCNPTKGNMDSDENRCVGQLLLSNFFWRVVFFCATGHGNPIPYMFQKVELWIQEFQGFHCDITRRIYPKKRIQKVYFSTGIRP